MGVEQAMKKDGDQPLRAWEGQTKGSAKKTVCLTETLGVLLVMSGDVFICFFVR